MPDSLVPSTPRWQVVEASDAKLTHAYACLDLLAVSWFIQVWNSLAHSLPKDQSALTDRNLWLDPLGLRLTAAGTTDHAWIFISKTLEHQRADGEVPRPKLSRRSLLLERSQRLPHSHVTELLRYQGSTELLRTEVTARVVREEKARHMDRKYCWDESWGVPQLGPRHRRSLCRFRHYLDSTADFRGGPDRKNNDFWCDFNCYTPKCIGNAWQAELWRP